MGQSGVRACAHARAVSGSTHHPRDSVGKGERRATAGHLPPSCRAQEVRCPRRLHPRPGRGALGGEASLCSWWAGQHESTQLSYVAAWPSLGASRNFYKGPCVLLLARWIVFFNEKECLKRLKGHLLSGS